MKIKGIILFVICVMLHIAATAQDRSVDIRRLLFEAYTLQNGGKMAEAAEKLKSIIEIDSTYKVAYLRLATLYNTSDENVKNLGEAQKNYEKYLSLETDIAKKDSLKKVLDDVKKRIDDIDSKELTAALEENLVLSNTQEQQDTVNHLFSLFVQEDDLERNAHNDNDIKDLDDIFSYVPDFDNDTIILNSISNSDVELDYTHFVAIDGMTDEKKPSSTKLGIEEVLDIFGKKMVTKDDDWINDNFTVAEMNDKYVLDPKVPLITFVQPYNLTELDYNTLDANTTVSNNYISALFSHVSGIDLLHIHSLDTENPFLDSNCGIEKAYSQIMGTNQIKGFKHGITSYKRNSDGYHLRLEYEMPATKTKGIELFRIVDLMIGDYMRTKKTTKFSNYYHALEIKDKESSNRSVLKFIYNFFLKPKRGLLVGDAKIQVIKHYDQDYLIATYTGQQVMLPVDESYYSYEIRNVDMIQESDPEQYLNKLEEMYNDYKEWHEKLTEADYDVNELYRHIERCIHSEQPEALYEWYIGNMVKLWYLKTPKGNNSRRESPAILIKKRMIKIGNILKNSL